MKKRFTDEIIIFIVMAFIGAVAILNICQTDRPTYSESENRKLAAFPEFSVQSIISGKYFSDFNDFVSDTFIGREGLVSLSKRMDTLKSLSLVHERDITVIINPNPDQGKDESDDFSLPPLPEFSEIPDVSEASEPETSASPMGTPVILSSQSASFTAGATYLLSAVLEEGWTGLTWTVSGDDGVTVTDNKDGTATVKGDKAGTAVVTATVSRNGESFKADCSVTVNAVVIDVPTQPAEFLPSGLIIYDGAAYSQSFFGAKTAANFATVYERYAQLFKGTQMSVVIAPLATITITDPDIQKKISDQGAILDKMEATIKGDVNFVNLKNVYLEHADEYLFYKSDHHWTHRGAYYAYSEFVKSVGFTPTPIDNFKVEILSTTYNGSMYNYTKDERVKNFLDTVEAYIPTKACTMTVQNQLGQTATYDFCINTKTKNYLAFINGDNPYTVINVPENPQDKSILVLKDSYGNAFVPYLTEHYGNIIVIDPRHVDMNIYEQFKDYGLTDIVFMVNTSSGNLRAWCDYLVNLIS